MLSYSRIETSKPCRKLIWKAEQQAPDWFKDANAVWTPTYPSYVRFWRSCGEVWGLFDDDELKAVVYLAFEDERSVNIHVSVVGRLPIVDIVRFFRSLTIQKGEDGVVRRIAWILEQNRFLTRIAEKAGYFPTGLKMDYGATHGQVLRWIEVRG